MTFDNFAEDKISADYLVDTAHCCTMYIVKYRRWEGVIIGRVSIPTLPFIEGVQEVGGGNNPVFPIRIILFFLSSDPYWQISRSGSVIKNIQILKCRSLHRK